MNEMFTATAVRLSLKPNFTVRVTLGVPVTRDLAQGPAYQLTANRCQV